MPSERSPSRPLEDDVILPLIEIVYKAILGRAPTPGSAELSHWSGQLAANMTPAEFVSCVWQCPEAIARRGCEAAFPNGHYYSPVVDSLSASDYAAKNLDMGLKCLDQINVDLPEMESLHQQWLGFKDVYIAENQKGGDRFSMAQSIQFPYGDAWALKAMVRWARPSAIIEVGCGSTTGCILDAMQAYDIPCKLICIDPDTSVLRDFMRPKDYEKVEILEMPVQHADITTFAHLQQGDILFVDSTHVLKTGSDLHYLLLKILPRLQKGVFIHFHDCMYPFEYPMHWILNNHYSWNEIYAIHLMLVGNSNYRIRYWSSLLAKTLPGGLIEMHPRLASQPGSGIWLEKLG